MKRLIIDSLVFVAAIGLIVACKSIKLEKVERTPTSDGTIIENAIRGEYYAYGLQNNLEGLEIDYTPTSGVHVAINKVSYDMSTQHAEIIDRSLAGSANLAGKIGAAIASAGGSAGAEAIYGYVKQFIAKGGDPSKATVTVSDGKLVCTDGSCIDVSDCPECIDR